MECDGAANEAQSLDLTLKHRAARVEKLGMDFGSA